MRSILIISCLLFLSYCFFGCSKPCVEQESSSQSEVAKDTVTFRGELALVPKNFPKQLLNQSIEEFDAYYAARDREASSRTNAAENYLTAEELLSILQPLARKYPDLSWEKDISEADLRRIYSDFPSITSPDEVREKSDLILAFYNDIFKPEAVAAVITYKNSRSHERTNSDSFGYIYDYEQSKVMSMPLFAPLYAMSAVTASSMASIYGQAEVGQKVMLFVMVRGTA